MRQPDEALDADRTTAVRLLGAVPLSRSSCCMVSAGQQIGARGAAQVTHHENSRAHWSELPARFLEALPAHDRAHGTRPPAPAPPALPVACS